MVRLLLIVGLGLGVAAPLLAKDATAPSVTVWIGAPLRDGFVDTTKEIQDSVGDLARRLRGERGITLVDGPDHAAVTITIVARGIGSEPYGQRLQYQQYYRSAILTSQPVFSNTWWVTAVLDVQASPYRKEFVGTWTLPPSGAYFGGAWTVCARELGKNLETWIQANRARLLAPAAVAALPYTGPMAAAPLSDDQRFCGVAQQAQREEPENLYWRAQVTRLCAVKAE